MHDIDKIQLKPIPETARFRNDLFALYKLSLHEHIVKTFGWDEQFQQDRFSTYYRDQEFLSVILEAVDVGYAVLKNDVGDIHLSLLLLQPEHQHRGIGQAVMRKLILRAIGTGRTLTLSCFLSNERAMRFYQQLGLGVVATDEHFVTFRYPAV